MFQNSPSYKILAPFTYLLQLMWDTVQIRTQCSETCLHGSLQTSFFFSIITMTCSCVANNSNLRPLEKKILKSSTSIYFYINKGLYGFIIWQVLWYKPIAEKKAHLTLQNKVGTCYCSFIFMYQSSQRLFAEVLMPSVGSKTHSPSLVSWALPSAGCQDICSFASCCVLMIIIRSWTSLYTCTILLSVLVVEIPWSKTGIQYKTL